MSDVLPSTFDRLLGRKATDQEVRRLYEVKEALDLSDNDAIWMVLLALEHYDCLYREYPTRIAEEARRTIGEVQRVLAEAAAVETKRAHRTLADGVAAAALQIASKQTETARVQGFAAAGAVVVTFGSLCLSIGYALGNGYIPPWIHGHGPRRLVGAALAAPAGWMLLILLLPVAARSVLSGWAATLASGATRRGMLVGWGKVLVAIAGVAALTTLLFRIL